MKKLLFLQIQWIIAHSNFYLLTNVHNEIINFDDKPTVGNLFNFFLLQMIIFEKKTCFISEIWPKNGQYLVKVSHLNGCPTELMRTISCHQMKRDMPRVFLYVYFRRPSE